MAENEKNNKKKVSKCRQCQFYDKEENNCMVKDIKEFREYNRKNKDCTDFMIQDKFIMF